MVPVVPVVPVVPDIVVDADAEAAVPGEADLTVRRALQSLDRAG